MKKSNSISEETVFFILSALVLSLVFGIGYLFKPPTRSGPKYLIQQRVLDPFGDSVYRQEAYYDLLEPGTQCKPQSVFSAELYQTPAIANMALEKEAKRMAAEFEYSKEDLNRGVKHFIAEMHEGLEKSGTHMSQIPTYVTAVPNGTEKVRVLWLNNSKLTDVGNIPRGRPWWHELSSVLDNT